MMDGPRHEINFHQEESEFPELLAQLLGISLRTKYDHPNSAGGPMSERGNRSGLPDAVTRRHSSKNKFIDFTQQRVNSDEDGAA